MNDRLKEYINSKHPVQNHLYQLLGEKVKPVIFDVGACEGEDSIRYSLMFPDAEIYSFEPLPENFKNLVDNLAHYKSKNIHPVNKAVSDSNGSEVLNISSGKPDSANEDSWNYGNKSSSLLRPNQVTKAHSWLKFEDTITVPTITLEEFLRSNPVEEIDLLHLDVRGAELKVLSGCGEYLNRINAIWLEVGNIEYYENQPLKKDIEEFLKKKSFQLITSRLEGNAGDQLYIRLNPHDQLALQSRSTTGIIKKLTGKVIDTWKKRGRTSYSQSGEDMILEHLCSMLQLNKPGYIDIGAHDPFHLNNSAWLYENGSRGINIEPDPIQFELFKKYRPEDVNLNIAIGSENKKCTLHIFKSRTLNTMNEKEAERLEREEKEIKISTHQVQTLDLYRCILLFSKGTFPDILFIDTEGLDYEILSQLNETKGLPKIICAETIHYSKTKKTDKNTELIKLIESKGYSVYADTFINTIFYQNNLI